MRRGSSILHDGVRVTESATISVRRALRQILSTLSEEVDSVVLRSEEAPPFLPERWKTAPSLEISVERPLEALRGTRLRGHVAAFPPFASGRDLPRAVREEHRGLDLPSLIFRYLVDEAPEVDQLTILLPLRFFRSQRLASLRTELFYTMPPRVLLEFENLGQALPNTHPRFQFGLLTVVRGEKDLLRFFRFPSDLSGDWTEVVEDFERILHQDGGRTAYGYVIREGLPSDAPLSHDLYSPELRDKEKALEELGDKRRLGDLLASVFRGVQWTLLQELQTDAGIPVLHPVQITADGLLPSRTTRDGAPRWVSKIPHPHERQPGDLCIRGVVPPGARLTLAEIAEDMLPLCPVGQVVVLRPRSDLPASDRALLKAFLASGTAARFLHARTTGVSLLISHLKELPVPAPDEALRVALSSVTKAIESFDRWKNEAVAARSALFEFNDVRGSRVDLLSVGQLSRRRQRAAALVEDHRHSIRTQYPHPVAYRWRVVEAAHPDLEGYIQVLECAETAVAFLASSAIATTRGANAPPIRKTKEIGEKVGTGRSGPSFGDWVGMLRELRDSKSFRDYRAVGPVPELPTFLEDEEVDSAIQRLSVARNELAHKKGPKGGAVPEAFESALSDLEVLLQGIRFVSEYALRYIESTWRDSISGLTRYSYRDLMGDHPLVPVETDQAVSAELEAGSLYLVDRAGDLHLLRPILTRQECPECHRFATFILDRFDPATETTTLISLEHGHAVEDRQQVEALRVVGLLSREEVADEPSA